MKKIRAKSQYPFANVMRKVGDVFDASESDANALVTVGLAEYVDAPNAYAHRAMPSGEDEKPQPQRQGKNRYPRRDMRAES